MDINEELKDTKYAEAYSEDKLFKKIVKFAKVAGIKVIYVALLCFYTLQSSKTPAWAKSVLVGALGYFILPVDLIPDFIPVLGYLDDVLLLPGLIWVAIKLLPADVLAECRTQADEWMASKAAKPTSKVGAVVVVLLWLAACLGAWYWWKSGMTG